ncbi:MAG: heme o synthase [Planctomycetota bacterium]
MSRATPAILSADSLPAERLRTRQNAWKARLELAKPGITRMVTITAIGGFALRAATDATAPATAYILPLIGCALGVALASAGGNALNMWLEAALDKKMARTADRPIPSGRLSANAAFWFGAWTTLIGSAIVALTGNATAGALTLISAALYVLIYTPLKTKTPWSTLVGAVPGALPPLIGAAAASDSFAGYSVLIDPIGVALFGLMMVWQLPHFMAIAMMYRDDYAAAGMKMLPVLESEAAPRTRFVTRVTAIMLIPASAWPAFATDLLGWPYAAIAIVSSIAFAVLAFRSTEPRRVFLASIAHLPILMLAMVAESALRFLL